jgi:hypothetical protein
MLAAGSAESRISETLRPFSSKEPQTSKKPKSALPCFPVSRTHGQNRTDGGYLLWPWVPSAGGAYPETSGCASRGSNRAGQPVQAVVSKIRLVPQIGVPGIFVHVSDHNPIVGAGRADLLLALPACLYTRIVIAYQAEARRREGSRADWMRWGSARPATVCLAGTSQGPWLALCDQ